jgi:hypothetical protein
MAALQEQIDAKQHDRSAALAEKQRCALKVGAIRAHLSALKDIESVGGALQDAVDMCHQELNDAQEIAKFIAGDILCLAVVATFAGNLSHPER